MKSPDVCAILRCSRLAIITYRGKPICGDHWEEHCEGKTRFSLNDLAAYKPEYRKVGYESV